MDNKTTYNTMVRIAGSFTSFALGFQAVMYTYGWNRVVLLSDQQVGQPCTYGASAIHQLLGQYIIPVYMKSTSLTSADYKDYLQTVQVNSRGIIV
jgi:Receptor family ligand binding region